MILRWKIMYQKFLGEKAERVCMFDGGNFVQYAQKFLLQKSINEGVYDSNFNLRFPMQIVLKGRS